MGTHQLEKQRVRRAPHGVVFTLGLCAVLISAFAGSRTAKAEGYTRRADVFRLIDAQWREGKLSLGQRHYYRLAALRSPHLLPQPFYDVVAYGEPSSGCFTPITVEAMQDLPSLEHPWRREVEELLLPPADLSYTEDVSSPWPIRVSYSSTSQASFAQSVLDAAVTSYEVEVQDWGFYEPAIESGATYYRYYIQDTGMGGGAYTAPYAENNGTSRLDYYTYVVVDPSNDSWSIPGIIAHEFNHSCQAAMDGAEVVAFWENSATYIMSEVFASAWPYSSGFFPIFQQAPFRPLEYMNQNQTDGYEYGGAVWIHFLEHVYGGEDPIWLRQIWEGTIQNGWTNEPDYFDMLEDVLQPHGGFADMVRRFGEYRFFVSSDDDGQHIPGSGSWPGAEVTRTATWNLSDIPVEGASPSSAERPQPNGYNYIVLEVSTSPYAPVEFGFSGEAGKAWSVEVMHVAQGQNTQVETMALDGQNEGTVTVQPEAGDRLVMVVAQLAPAGYDPDNQQWSGASYTYSITHAAPEPVLTAVTPSSVARGSTGVSLTLSGEHFIDSPALQVQFSGGGITTGNPLFVSSQELNIQINVDANAALGPRDVYVTNPDGEMAEGMGLLTITTASTGPDAGVPADSGTSSDGGPQPADASTGEGNVSGGCSCRTALGSDEQGPIAPLFFVLIVVGLSLRLRHRAKH